MCIRDRVGYTDPKSVMTIARLAVTTCIRVRSHRSNSSPGDIMPKLWLSFAVIGFIVALALSSTLSSAQTPNWPQRTVKFIIPLGPGSGVDITARLFADKLTAKWGQTVVVENRPGGDAIVAINAVISAHDDHAYAILRPQVQAGKVKVVAMTNQKHAAALPDIPTSEEAGFKSLSMDGLVGLLGPRDMLLAVRERIAADIREIAADPTII